MAKKTKHAKPSTRRPAQPNARALEVRARLATLKAKARFLREFSVCGIVLRAARSAKVGRRTVYDWLAQDGPFKVLYDEAYEDANDAMEEEARRRGEDGVLEPVFQGGKRVGLIRKYSDALLITMLKARRPDVFRERMEHTGPKGAALTFTVKLADHRSEEA